MNQTDQAREDAREDTGRFGKQHHTAPALTLREYAMPPLTVKSDTPVYMEHGLLRVGDFRSELPDAVPLPETGQTINDVDPALRDFILPAFIDRNTGSEWARERHERLTQAGHKATSWNNVHLENLGEDYGHTTYAMREWLNTAMCDEPDEEWEIAAEVVSRTLARSDDDLREISTLRRGDTADFTRLNDDVRGGTVTEVETVDAGRTRVVFDDGSAVIMPFGTHVAHKRA